MTNTCIVCGGPIPEIAVQAEDPFCTTTCCREHHGCPLPPTEAEQRRADKLDREESAK